MYHTKVQTSVLLNAVKTCSQTVPQKTNLFCLNNIMLTGDSILGTLVLRSSDLDNFCEVSIPSIGTNNNEIFVDLKTLTRSITNLKATDLEVVIDDKLNFKCDDFEININHTVSKDEYPSFPVFIEGKRVLKMKYSKFLTALRRVGFAACNDSTRVQLSNVCIRFSENKAIFGATNGHKLIEYKTEYFEPSVVPEILLMASKIIKFLIYNPGDMIEINIQKTDKIEWIQIKSGNAILTSKYQFDSSIKEYPDYEKVILTNHNKFATFNREALIDVVKNLSMVSNHKTKLIKMTFAPDLETCCITAENTFKEVNAFMRIPVEYTGEEFKVGLNSVILLQVLQKMKSEYLTMAMKEQTSAIVFTPAVPKNEILLVMPLKLMAD